MGMDREDKYTLELIDLSDDTQVNSGGGTDTKSLQPPSGFVYEIVNLFLLILDPVGSTSGTHKITVLPQNQTSANMLYIISNSGADIRIQYNYLFTGTTKLPSQQSAQQVNVKAITVSYNQPIDFVYVNSTDANQTGTRTITALVKKYREAVL